MSVVREYERAPRTREKGDSGAGIYLIEHSAAVAMMLREKIEAAGIPVQWFETRTAAEQAIARQRPALVITGLCLPDGPEGEMLQSLHEANIATILFTTILNRQIRKKFASTNIVDYFIKGAPDSIDNIIRIARQMTTNTAIPVLVVDDKQSARQPLVELLQRQNYRVLEAETGMQALNILAQEHDVALVITDHQMPDMDGYALTQRIRSDHDSEHLRIIGISSSTDPYLSAAFLKAGAADFIYRPFNAEEVQCRFANNIETLETMRQLRFLAERDPMTGLFNRRAFFERARILFDQWQQARRVGSVAILDIDHFKNVNDTYGHDAGDTVIRAVADELGNLSRASECLTARLGGEEFVMLFSETDSDKVLAACTKIRQSIAERTINHHDLHLNVTVSIGVARIQHEEGIDNNLNAADQMLYMAKNAGRNQVISDAAFYNA